MNRQRVTLHCPCTCGRRTKDPCGDKWFETFDWSVISADDPRDASAAQLWFASARCCWRYGQMVLLADLSSAAGGDGEAA